MRDRAAGLLAEIERACTQIRAYLSGFDRRALRNRIAHGHDEINRAQIWDLCEEHLETLERGVARMLIARGEPPP